MALSIWNWNKTKEYDGTVAMIGLNMTSADTQTLDDVLVAGTGAFADKNVSRNSGALAANKSYTIDGLALSGADAGNYYLASSTLSASDGQITPKSLAVTYAGVNKVYDGLDDATVTTTDNRVAGDTFSISQTAKFADKHVARDINSNPQVKNITISNLALANGDASNYTATAAGSPGAIITPKSLNISGITAADKIYNATNATTLSTTALTKNGLVGSDDVVVAVTGTFADANAATGKTVSIGSTITGADKDNYTITTQNSTLASILKRQVTVSVGGSVSKAYDGTTAMIGVQIGLAGVNGVADSGVIGGQTVDITGIGSFSSSDVSRDGSNNVLANKSYSLSNLQLSGVSAINYEIAGGASSISGSNGRIDAKAVTLTPQAASKVYDGTTHGEFVLA